MNIVKPSQHPQAIDARTKVSALRLDAYVEANFNSYADAYTKALTETTGFTMVLHTDLPQCGDVVILRPPVEFGPPHELHTWNHCHVATLCGPGGALLIYTTSGLWPVRSVGSTHSIWRCTLGHINPGLLAQAIEPYYKAKYKWGTNDCFALMDAVCDVAGK